MQGNTGRVSRVCRLGTVLLILFLAEQSEQLRLFLAEQSEHLMLFLAEQS